MRAFIAIDLPEEARRSLRTLQQGLARAVDHAALSRTVRWSAIDGIHLTLRFLGESSEEAHKAMASRLETIAATSHAFDLTLRGVGCFPNLHRPSVVWAGVDGELDRLGALQSPIENAAREVRFAPESRTFSPHLTLGRFRREAAPADLARAGEVVRQFAQSHEVAAWGVPLAVDSVVFFQSDLRPAGAVYTALDRFMLG